MPSSPTNGPTVPSNAAMVPPWRREERSRDSSTKIAAIGGGGRHGPLVGGGPATHIPAPLQVATPLQGSPSSHSRPNGAGSCATPVDGSHESIVHGLLSSGTGGAWGSQVPAPSQVSSPLQRSPSSSQPVPLAYGGCETPVPASH